MDLTFDAEQEAFRSEARSWLAGHVPTEPLPSMDTAAGFEAHREWEAALFADRWSVVSWPREYGGRDVGITPWLIFEEEYFRARAPQRVSENGVFLLAPALLEYGTAEQKERYLRPMASGQEIWCQGWSEPEAGRHLAGVDSKAVRNAAGDSWLLSGQKTGVGRGAFADWCFGLFRTGPLAERDRGLSYFLVALDSPGVTVRPVLGIDGRAGFTQIIFDHVEVPDNQVLGGDGAGWSVAMSIAGSERGMSLRSPARHTEAAARLVDLFARRGSPAVWADPVAQAYINAEACQLHTYWTATEVSHGHAVDAEVNCNNIFWFETDVAIHKTALALLGAEAEVLEAGSPGEWLEGYLVALALTGYPGTSEIQRTAVAERLLGLPPS